MKIFVMDCGWAGSIIVVAENEEQARELMKPCYNYDPKEKIVEVPIVPGLIWNNLGDM